MAKGSSIPQIAEPAYVPTRRKPASVGINAGSSGAALTIAFQPDSANLSKLLFENYNRLVDRVVDVFGDEIVASEWLSSPSTDFEQRSPLQVAREQGYELSALEPVLIRIEHGVYF